MFYVVWSHFDPCDCNSPFASSKSLLLLVLLCPAWYHTYISEMSIWCQIKSILLSHHHSTCALMSEILESVHQTVQKQFIYRQYILTDLYRRQCAEWTYTQYTHSVLLDILTVINTHYTPYVHIIHYVHIYTHSNMQRCNRLYISYVSWMCIRTTRFCAVCVCSPTVLKLKCSAWHTVKWGCAVGCLHLHLQDLFF